jgi:hypothetical protein
VLQRVLYPKLHQNGFKKKKRHNPKKSTTLSLLSTAYQLCRPMAAYAMIVIMTTTTLTSEYSHIHPHFFLRTTTSECYFCSPGQYVTRIDDKVDRGGPVLVRNHPRSVAVQLQYTLYQVEYFTKCKFFVPYLGFPVLPPTRSWRSQSEEVQIVKRVRTYYSPPCRHSGSTKLRTRSNNPA